MGGGDRQAGPGGDDHGRGRGQGGGKAATRGQLGDSLADGGNHLVTVHHQSRDDADPAQQQNPGRHQRTLGYLTLVLHDADDRRQRPNGIGHVIGAVGESHGTGGDHHQNPEDFLHVGEMIFPIRGGIELKATNEIDTDQHDDDADGDGHQIIFQNAQFQADMLESLEHGDQGHDEADQKNI